MLRYIADPELQTTIQAAMNKNEPFNNVGQWVASGGDGTIAGNDRREQRKSVKYTHAVANCSIFYNAARPSRALARLHDQGYPLDPEAVAALSPYRAAHLDRFGRYTPDLTQVPEPPGYDLPILSAATPWVAPTVMVKWPRIQGIVVCPRVAQPDTQPHVPGIRPPVAPDARQQAMSALRRPRSCCT